VLVENLALHVQGCGWLGLVAEAPVVKREHAEQAPASFAAAGKQVADLLLKQG